MYIGVLSPIAKDRQAQRMQGKPIPEVRGGRERRQPRSPQDAQSYTQPELHHALKSTLYTAAIRAVTILYQQAAPCIRRKPSALAGSCMASTVPALDFGLAILHRVRTGENRRSRRFKGPSS